MGGDLGGVWVSILILLVPFRVSRVGWHSEFAFSFLVGISCAFLADIVERLAAPFVLAVFPGSSVPAGSAFLMIALVEETAKVALIYAALLKHRDRTFPMAGMRAVSIAAGFAVLENLSYAFRFGPEVLEVRALTAMPLHLSLAVIAARLIWSALGAQPPRAAMRLCLALAVPIGVHGLYDYLVGLGLAALWWLVLGAVVLPAFLWLRQGQAATDRPRSD